MVRQLAYSRAQFIVSNLCCAGALGVSNPICHFWYFWALYWTFCGIHVLFKSLEGREIMSWRVLKWERWTGGYIIVRGFRFPWAGFLTSSPLLPDPHGVVWWTRNSASEIPTSRAQRGVNLESDTRSQRLTFLLAVCLLRLTVELNPWLPGGCWINVISISKWSAGMDNKSSVQSPMWRI